MARRNRDLNVFNLSFLDVLSCALGAVILVLVLMPDTEPEPLVCPEIPACPACESCQQCPEPNICPDLIVEAPICPEPVTCPTCEVCQSCPEPKPCPTCPKPKPCPTCPDCKEDVAILISIIWETGKSKQRQVDIDLHILPPIGYPEISFRNKETIRGETMVMKLTHDNLGQIIGPEVFFSPRAPEGDWKVLLNYYEGEGSTTVTGDLYWAEGQRAFKAQAMDSGDKLSGKRTIATFSVKKGKLTNLKLY